MWHSVPPCQVSYMEIYCERVKDLLNPKSKGNLRVRWIIVSGRWKLMLPLLPQRLHLYRLPLPPSLAHFLSFFLLFHVFYSTYFCKASEYVTLGTPNVSQASQIQMHSGAEPSVLFVGVLHWRGSLFIVFTYQFLLPLSLFPPLFFSLSPALLPLPLPPSLSLLIPESTQS